MLFLQSMLPKFTISLGLVSLTTVLFSSQTVEAELIWDNNRDGEVDYEDPMMMDVSVGRFPLK